MAIIRGTNYADLFLHGTAGRDTIYGYDGDDIIFGIGGYDQIYAGGGNDLVHAGTGAGAWYGGNGTDTLIHSGTASNTFNLSTGKATVSGLSAFIDGFENLTTGSGNDSITGSSVANVIRSGNGNDSIATLGGDDQAWGGNGHDYIDGGAGNDVVYGEVGNDVLVGGRGNDRLFGGTGTDSLFGGDGDDVLAGGYGNDALYGGAGYDTISFAELNSGIVVSMASSIAQTRRSGTPDDTDRIGDDIENIIGTSHDDLIFLSDYLDVETGHGNDGVWAGQGANYMNGGSGTDVLSYSNSTAGVTMRLDGGIGSGGWAAGDQAVGFENLNGSQYADQLIGNAGANRLDGGNGNDILRGGNGDDVLIGGQGMDMLYGGVGKDTFIFRSTADSMRNTSDHIADFQKGDRIDVSTIDANLHTGGSQSFYRVVSVADPSSSAHFTAGTINVLHTPAGNTRIEFNTSDNATNGIDLPEMVITLEGLHQIGLSDFIL